MATSIAEIILNMSARSVDEVYAADAASSFPLTAVTALVHIRNSALNDFSAFDPTSVDLTIAGIVGIYSKKALPDQKSLVQIVTTLPVHLREGRVYTVRAIAHLASNREPEDAGFLGYQDLEDEESARPKVKHMGTAQTERTARRYIEAYPSICNATYGDVALDTFSVFRDRWVANYEQVSAEMGMDNPDKVITRTTRLTVREQYGQETNINYTDPKYIPGEAVLANFIDRANAHSLATTGRMRVWVDETSGDVTTGDTLITDAAISAKYHPRGRDIFESLIRLYWIGPNSTPIGLAKALAVAADPGVTKLALHHAHAVRSVRPHPPGADFSVVFTTAEVMRRMAELRPKHGGKMISMPRTADLDLAPVHDDDLGFEIARYTGDEHNFDRLDANNRPFLPDEALLHLSPVALYEPLVAPPESSSSSSRAAPDVSALQDLAEAASQEQPKPSGKVPRRTGVEREKTPFDRPSPAPPRPSVGDVGPQLPRPSIGIKAPRSQMSSVGGKSPRSQRPSLGGKSLQMVRQEPQRPSLGGKSVPEPRAGGRPPPSEEVLARKAARRRMKAMEKNGFGTAPWGKQDITRWLIRFMADPRGTMGKDKPVSGAQILMYVDEAFSKGAKPTARELAFMITKRCNNTDGGWVPERFMLFYKNSVKLYGEEETRRRVAEIEGENGPEDVDSLLNTATVMIAHRTKRQKAAGSKPKKKKPESDDESDQDGDDDAEMQE